MRILGLDVGGANLKWATLSADGERITWESGTTPVASAMMARDPIAAIALIVPGSDFDTIMATQTACVLFDEYAEGTRHVFRGLLDHFGMHAGAWTVDNEGAIHRMSEALLEPERFAATNIAVTGRLVSSVCPTCVVLDMGSSSTDILPIANGVFRCAMDAESRLMNGQLVYVGMIRTPLQNIADSLPWHGRMIPLAGEAVAMLGDVHLVLEAVSPSDYGVQPWSAGGKTSAGAMKRLARSIAMQRADGTEEQLHILAAYAAEKQMALITQRLLQVASASPEVLCCAVITGLGGSLLTTVTERLGIEALQLHEMLCLPQQIAYSPAVGSCLLAAMHVGLLSQEQVYV